MKYYSVTWKQLHSATYALTEKIKSNKIKPDLIVGIARGGLTIAHIASDFLRLPLASFTISSYKDLKQQKMSEISFHVGGDLKNKHVLLMDDVSDTGKTFVRGIEYLKSLGASQITTASPYIKPWTKHFPDYYVKKVDEWIIFPYDMRETVEAVSKMMKKESKSIEEIKQKLQSLHISKRFTDRYCC